MAGRMRRARGTLGIAMRQPVAQSRRIGRDADARPRDSQYPAGFDDADERITEIAEILAAGLMRLWARKSSQISADLGESSLALSGQQSGHADPVSPEVQA